MTREEVRAAVRRALEKRAAGAEASSCAPAATEASRPAVHSPVRNQADPAEASRAQASGEGGALGAIGSGVAAEPPAPGKAGLPLEFVSAREVEEAHRRGERRLEVSAGGIVTPLARDAAAKHGLELVRFSGPRPGESAASRKVRTVALAADHGGYALKEALEKAVAELGYEVHDLGTHSPAPAEYPDLAYELAKKVALGVVDRGIVVDGAGIGSAIVANKVGGIRAAHCHDLYEARNSRLHNDANVLSLGGRTLGEGLALEIVKEWLSLEFEGGRHARRVARIEEIERAEGRAR